jgi:hypothetical protein
MYVESKKKRLPKLLKKQRRSLGQPPSPGRPQLVGRPFEV